MSWMGRVMYTYDNRYMLMATVRADASSRLAKGHQWHTYPAVSSRIWNIRQEEFMDEVGLDRYPETACRLRTDLQPGC